MAKTRLELVQRALKDLGALPAGQTANSEELDVVDDMVDPLVERLAAEHIYHVQDTSAIEDSAFQWLGICLAWACASEFGEAAIAVPLAEAEARLSLIQAAVPTYKPLEIIAW